MRSFLLAAALSLAGSALSHSGARAHFGERGPSKPKEPDPKDDEEPPSTRLDEQWKWMLAGFVVAMVGYTSWRLWSEAGKVRPREKRAPWEIE